MGREPVGPILILFRQRLEALFFATVILSQQHDRINWLNNQLLHMEFLPKVASTNKRCMKTWYCTCRFLVFPLSPQSGLNWHFEVWSSTDFCVSIFQCFCCGVDRNVGWGELETTFMKQNNALWMRSETDLRSLEEECMRLQVFWMRSTWPKQKLPLHFPSVGEVVSIWRLWEVLEGERGIKNKHLVDQLE